MIPGNVFNVLALYGSPRRDGNTDELLNSFINGLNDNEFFKRKEIENITIDKIFVSKLKISPCRECRHCSIDGECVVNDEMQQIYPKIIDCDLLLVGSPVFFTTVPGNLKSFIDRFQRFWALKYELNKRIATKPGRKGILFSCAGSKPENIFECTRKVMRAFFDVIYIEYFADFLYNSIDFKGDIQNDPEMLTKVYDFAKMTIF